MPYRPHGKALVDPYDPRAFAICQRCGSLYNSYKLNWQHQWLGTKLQNKWLQVCQDCTDKPSVFLRQIILPPDPPPVYMPVTEPYAIDFINNYTISALMAAVSGSSVLYSYGAHPNVTFAGISGSTAVLVQNSQAYTITAAMAAVSGETASVGVGKTVFAANAAVSGETGTALRTAQMIASNDAVSGEASSLVLGAILAPANAAVSGETAAFTSSTPYTITAANAAVSGETAALVLGAVLTATNAAVSGETGTMLRTAQMTAVNAAVSGETAPVTLGAVLAPANAAVSGETAPIALGAVLAAANAAVSGETAPVTLGAVLAPANAAVSGETAPIALGAVLAAANAAVSGETAAFAAPATAPFDTAVGVVAAYSTRKLLSAYAGSALRVRRSSDNTELDIGFDGIGNLDQTALTTFVGANSGFVSVWYDQSGSARNLAQAVTTSQLRIVNAGVVDTINTRVSPYAPNGSPAYAYSNATTFLNNNRAEFFQIGSSDVYTAPFVARFLSLSVTGSSDTAVGGFVASEFNNGPPAQIRTQINTGSLVTTGYFNVAANTLVSIYTSATATALNIVITSGSAIAAWTPGILAVNNIMLAQESPTGPVQCGKGYMSEFVLTSANQTTPTTFTAEQKTYWGAA
jgi:hypothetical protein